MISTKRTIRKAKRYFIYLMNRFPKKAEEEQKAERSGIPRTPQRHQERDILVHQTPEEEQPREREGYNSPPPKTSDQHREFKAVRSIVSSALNISEWVS